MRWIAVTNRKLCRDGLYRQVKRLCNLDNKPFAIIVREKDLSEEEYIALAQPVMELCSRFGIKCVFHSFYEGALSCGVRAIHLPLPVLLENPNIVEAFDEIGVSVHSAKEAVLACEKGADYITFGHIFATDCKKGLAPRGVEALKGVVDTVKERFPAVCVYAIGGINSENAVQCFESGADGVCVMSEAMRL